MARPIPVLPTIVVLAAVAVMIRLGFWQIDRLHQKEALLAHYAAAREDRGEVPWPTVPASQQALMYRHARLDCLRVTGHSSIAGTSARGETGVSQTADCLLPGGARALVALGWSRQPIAARDWAGGEVHGVIAPGPRLVADPPLAGLEANAIPDASEIPNNHLSYAVQWFLFALTALVIYGLALIKRRPSAAVPD